MKVDRRYWLWVARPDDDNLYYLENASDDINNWTTSPETQTGDLAVVYLTSPVKSIAHLCEIVSDSYPSERDGPAYVCDYLLSVRAPVALTLEDMQADRLLAKEFAPMKAKFRRRVYELTPEVFGRLMGMVAARNPGLGPKLPRPGKARLPRETLYESQIEKELFDNPDILGNRLGLQLQSVERQRYCQGIGFIDLLYKYRGGWVVVELKRGRAMRPHMSQVAAYMGWVREHLAGDKRVRGVLIAAGHDHKYKTAAGEIPDLEFIHLNDLGFG